MVDVGGDVLARGDEPGLRSPLCDAIMLAAAARLAAAGTPVLLGVFGVGCDAELTLRGGAGPGWPMWPPPASCAVLAVSRRWSASRLEECIELVPTEASAQAVRAFRGVRGPVSIRDGRRSFELSTVAALTFYLDASITYASVGRPGPGRRRHVRLGGRPRGAGPRSESAPSSGWSAAGGRGGGPRRRAARS